MKALITAGGKGTRMRPLTFSTNKHFIPLAGKPLLFYGLDELLESGIREIGINYNPGQLEELQSVLGTGEKWDAKFTFILQEQPLGLAHIIKVSREFINGDKFVMHLGDNIFFGGIKKLVDKFAATDVNALLTVIHHPENFRLGVPYFDADGKLTEIVEKPEHPPHDMAVPGLYFFDANVFKCFEGPEAIVPSARGELEIGSTYNWLLKHDYKVMPETFNGTWLDPGKFDDWLAANQFLLEHNNADGLNESFGDDVRIEGRVGIGHNCRIKSSTLIGPTVIGDNVIIEDAEIGPFCTVSEGCQIKRAKIKNSILAKNVQLDSQKKEINASLIGEGTIISGNGNNGAMELFIGSQCVVKS